MEVEINETNKRDTAFHVLNQRIDNFNVLLEGKARLPTEHKIRMMLSQLNTWEDKCKEAHCALMRVVMEQARKEEAIVKFTALNIKLLDVRNLVTYQLPRSFKVSH